MKIVIAEIISYLFHPVLFFLLMPFFVVYRYTDNGIYALKWMIFSSLFIISGMGAVFIGRLRGNYSDFDLSKKEERARFFKMLLFLGFIYLGIALFFKGFRYPMSIISLGIAIGILCFIVVNHYIKASLHVGVATAFVITLTFLYGQNAFLLLLPVLPVVMWSRFILKRHSPYEMVVGGILGVIIPYVTFLIARFFY